MKELQQTTGQAAIRAMMVMAFAIPALLYLSWQRETVLIVAFCLVLAINAFCLGYLSISKTTYANIAGIAPLVLFGAFLTMSTAPCMIEGTAKQTALFLSYSIAGMFPVAVPALVYVTSRKIMDGYSVPELDLGLSGFLHPKPATSTIAFRSYHTAN